jgi:hypothetical protein
MWRGIYCYIFLLKAAIGLRTTTRWSAVSEPMLLSSAESIAFVRSIFAF